MVEAGPWWVTINDVRAFYMHCLVISAESSMNETITNAGEDVGREKPETLQMRVSTRTAALEIGMEAP